MDSKAVSIIFILIVLISGCIESDDTFRNEYNAKIQAVNNLVQEHDSITNEINSNLNNSAVNRQKMEEYLDWIEKNRDAFSDFKVYVEANYQKIRGLGANPDYVRDNIISVMDKMQQNELSIRKTIALQDYYAG